MAKVQIQNGYTKIANEILEEIAKIKLSPTQYRLLFVIWRFTYGFHRKYHDISISFLSRATGCDTSNIHKELKKLAERKLIFLTTEPGRTSIISFNKNHEEWIGKKSVGKKPESQMTIGNSADTTFGQTTEGTSCEIHQQEINKNTIKKTMMSWAKQILIWNMKNILVHLLLT